LGVWAGEEPTVQNERSEEGVGESGNAKGQLARWWHRENDGDR
jgi:hypothetical protein